MPINYPKFDKKISDQIEDAKFRQTKNRPGTIMSYNSAQNTATIIVDEKYSSNIREHAVKRTMPVYLRGSNGCPGTRNKVSGRI